MMYNLFNDGIGSVELIDSMGTDKTAVDAARVSFLCVVSEKDQRLIKFLTACLLYTSPSPRDGLLSRMPSSA